VRLKPAIAMFAAVLGGCSLAPAYSPPKVATPAAYKETGPWQTSAPADQLPRGAWWQVFHDASLDALEQQAAAANPSLTAALAHYDVERAILAQARSSLFPDIFMGGSETRNRQSDNRPLRGGGQPDVYNADTLGVGADYEVDLWGDVRNRVDAGTAETQAAAADLQDVRLSLQAQLAAAYISLRGLDAQAKLLADTVDIYAKALQLVQFRHSGGIASGLDVDRAEDQLESAKAEALDVAGQRALYEHAIAALVGQSASAFSLAPSTAQINIPHLPAGVPSTLLQRRPDIAAAERRAAAANALIGVARASFFPVIDIDATGGYQNTAVDQWLTSPNKYWSIGPSFLLNLFDAGYREAEVGQAKAQFVEASADYRVLILTAFREVEDNLVLLNDLSEEAVEQQAAIDAADQTRSLSLDRYREGTDNYLDVVTAQAEALQAESRGLNLTTRRLQASVGLIRAIGGGWSLKDMPADSTLTDYDEDDEGAKR
jgi:NodT family efflux transporter outer membrane factor (OMF) lipoprotein